MARRRKLSAALKAKVALEAVKGHRSINEIAAEYDVHPTQVSKWKKQLIESSVEAFTGKQEKREEEFEAERDQLFRQIGQLKVEVDWLKKKTGHLD